MKNKIAIFAFFVILVFSSCNAAKNICENSACKSQFSTCFFLFKESDSKNIDILVLSIRQDITDTTILATMSEMRLFVFDGNMSTEIKNILNKCTDSLNIKHQSLLKYQNVDDLFVSNFKKIENYKREIKIKNELFDEILTKKNVNIGAILSNNNRFSSLCSINDFNFDFLYKEGIFGTINSIGGAISAAVSKGTILEGFGTASPMRTHLTMSSVLTSGTHTSFTIGGVSNAAIALYLSGKAGYAVGSEINNLITNITGKTIGDWVFEYFNSEENPIDIPINPTIKDICKCEDLSGAIFMYCDQSSETEPCKSWKGYTMWNVTPGMVNLLYVYNPRTFSCTLLPPTYVEPGSGPWIPYSSGRIENTQDKIFLSSKKPKD